jgi:two-component system, sensor histidine kinase
MTTPHDPSLDERVNHAKIDVLFQRTPATSLAGVLFSLLLAWALGHEADRHVLWIWFGLRCLITVLRIGLSVVYQSSGHKKMIFWRHAFMLGVLLDALSWGVLGLWLIPVQSTDISALVLIALLGVVSVGSAVFQHHWRAAAGFSMCMLLPIAVQQIAQADPSSIYVGVALLFFLTLTIFEARSSERRISELLRLRFNTDRIAEERAQALLLAERQSSVKSQFLATMSHEMRTPLHGILGITRGLRKKNTQDTESLALVERAGEHLLTLINDALDFSKLEAGQVRLQPQAFDLAALIDDIVLLSRPPAYEAGLNLNLRLRMPRPCVVWGDPSRVRQVLHNMVGNAIKFTAIGSVTIVAKHNTKRGRTRIAVHDTGIGITATELPRIFEAFHQADSSFTRRYAGTGLGLTIARDLARAMGGDLVVTSQPGRGSCFTMVVNLPIAEVDLPLDFEPAQVSTLSGHVLLAEDNAVNALVAKAVLKKLGLDVTLVENGEQALQTFCTKRPDLVLLDCHMPVMDGLEAARQIRLYEKNQGLPPTPLIALTANALQGDREKSLAAGMNEHLAKPFRDEELGALLAEFLKQKTKRTDHKGPFKST